jgi:tRNA-specific 2-thiouridylase
MNANKTIIAMSGGVDSSVAAARLVDAGLEVVGLTMNLFSCHRPKDKSCCSASDRLDAREVCALLGIKLQVVDLRERFRSAVIDPFVEDYLCGRTPSPCIRCNARIKFPVLLEEAGRMHAGAFATGHYARLVRDGEIMRLFRARDRDKDQSYFLFSLGQDVLSRLVLPLGEMSKSEVRADARLKGLPVHEKVESQEICFVPDDDYAGFVEETAGERVHGPGDFLDADGHVVGMHRGIHAYTVGQRRGLRLGGGPRRYVLGIDAEANAVVVGSDVELMQKEMVLDAVSWIHPSFATARDVIVRIRSTHVGEMARIVPLPDGRTLVAFEKPVRAIAPGQAAVFYAGDEVLGGGWITSTPSQASR